MNKFTQLRVLLLLLLAAFSLNAQAEEFNWKLAGQILVQDGGRVKPLDTFARETISDVYGADTYQGQNPVETYFLWMADGSCWRDVPLIYLPKGDLRKELGLNDAKSSRFTIPELRGKPRLMEIMQEAQAAQQAGEKLSFTQSKTNEVLHKISTLQLIFAHDIPLYAPPEDGNPDVTWLSMPEALEQLKRDSMNAVGSPESLSNLGIAFAGMYHSITDNRAEMFNTSAAIFVETQQQMLADFPDVTYRAGIEVTYNHFQPFFWARLALLLAAALFALAYRKGFEKYRAYGMYAMIAGFLLFATGMYLRWIIGGRAPWSNMYESLLAIGATLVLISAIYELIKRDKIFGLAGSLMGGVILWLAHYASLDRGINPLVPALQSYWLIYHVIIILASYGCFAVAMVIGHILLVQAVKSKGEMTPQLVNMSKANLHVMQVGSLLLIFGILLGAVWAEVSWGRFWGWDPKETWALISWFVYIALLHGRSAGWLNWKGLAFASVAVFPVVVMTYYGVNFYLSGLHSYGAGSSPGIPWEAFGYLILESVFLTWIALKLKGGGWSNNPSKPPSSGSSTRTQRKIAEAV